MRKLRKPTIEDVYAVFDANVKIGDKVYIIAYNQWEPYEQYRQNYECDDEDECDTYEDLPYCKDKIYMNNSTIEVGVALEILEEVLNIFGDELKADGYVWCETLEKSEEIEYRVLLEELLYDYENDLVCDISYSILAGAYHIYYKDGQYGLYKDFNTGIYFTHFENEKAEDDQNGISPK